MLAVIIPPIFRRGHSGLPKEIPMGLLKKLFGFLSRDDDLSSLPKSHLVETHQSYTMTSPSEQFPTHEALVIHCLKRFDRDLNEFITFTNENRPDHFVQVVHGENTDFNFHYPYADDPRERMQASGVFFPESFELLDWEAGTYAMYNGQRIDGTEVAEIIDALFVCLLAASPEFTLIGSIE
jgi:hypothetical protein